MSESHERIQEDLAAYAFGGLDSNATARVEEHLRHCRECRDMLREYSTIVEFLPLALSPSPPSPASRLALQQRVRADGRRHRRAEHLRRPWSPARLRALPWATLVGLLLIIAGVGIWWSAFMEQPAGTLQPLRARDDVQVVRLVGSAAAPTAGGQLLMTPDLSQAGIEVRGLPQLPADRSYQVWFYRPDGTWSSGGTFRVDQQGRAEVTVRIPGSLTTYNGCWITEEPTGGSPAPSGRQILVAAQS